MSEFLHLVEITAKSDFIELLRMSQYWPGNIFLVFWVLFKILSWLLRRRHKSMNLFNTFHFFIWLHSIFLTISYCVCSYEPKHEHIFSGLALVLFIIITICSSAYKMNSWRYSSIVRKYTEKHMHLIIVCLFVCSRAWSKNQWNGSYGHPRLFDLRRLVLCVLILLSL